MTRWLRRRETPPSSPAPLTAADLLPLIAHTNSTQQPNLNALRQVANLIEPISLNIKQMGYQLARDLAAGLPAPGDTAARHVGLPNGLSTQKAIESDWVAHWCRQLKIPVVYHRKIWELGFVLQTLHDFDLIKPGVRGLGFGCGTEPLPSYFAAHAIDITATDLASDQAAQSGWVRTGQHASAPEQAFMGHLVGRDAFDRHVGLRFVDMNAIPDDLRDYDFCWSICALEHLGSIQNGLDFIENSLDTLRPGGVAVHTTEFNIREDGPTIDNWPSVLFQRKHLEALAEKLRGQGHRVADFDFSLGDGPLDRFIDLPPYHHDLPAAMTEWLGHPAHLKIAFDGFVATCAGLAIQKAA
jgi:SAM-dependent methyltransferase